MAAAAIQRKASTVPWWLVLLQGIAALVVGLALLAAPGSSLYFLAQVLGIYWLVAGILGLVSMFQDSRQWGWKLAFGILGIISGIVVLQHPAWSTVFLSEITVFLLMAAFLIGGFMEMMAGITGRDWGLAILGGVTCLLGIVLMVNPMVGLGALPVMLGLLGIVGGILAIIFAIRNRSGASASSSYSSAGGSANSSSHSGARSGGKAARRRR